MTHHPRPSPRSGRFAGGRPAGGRFAAAASALVLLAVAGCEAPTAPVDPSDTDATLRRVQVLEAPTGNPLAHFLPPVAPSVETSGVFDGTLPLEIRVYEGPGLPCAEGEAGAGGAGAAGTCPALVAAFSTAGRGAQGIRVNDEEEHYIANWAVGGPGGGPFRIQARADGVLLESVVIATAQGTLPIRIRIEEGALGITTQPISDEGGEVRSTDGSVTLSVPQGAVEEEETFTIQRLAVETETDSRVIEGTKHQFGPAGATFAEPVRITLSFDPERLPAGLGASRLRLHRLVGSTWQLIPGSSVDLEANTVTGEVSHFSVFAALPAAFEQVDTGEFHACGLTADGAAWCWGSNGAGQLGAPAPDFCGDAEVGGVVCATTAVEVEGDLRFQQLSTGLDHTCGLTLDGDVFCWGRNLRGQLGDGSTLDSPAPVQVAASERFVEVNVQNQVSCARADTGTLFCWGNNFNGQLGTTTTEDCSGATCSTTPIAVPLPGSVAQVSVGLVHACAVLSGESGYCWGRNSFRQLGHGAPTATGIEAPVQVVGGPWQRISAGAVHTCGIAGGGQGFCWGLNLTVGGLGDGLNTDSSSPVQVAGGIPFQSLDASNGNYVFLHSCGVSTTSQAFCWGANADGALGVDLAPETCNFSFFGDFDCAFTPVPVSGGLSFASVSLGRGFTCGITTDGETWCWGLNSQAQLGNGTTTGSRGPVQVATGP